MLSRTFEAREEFVILSVDQSGQLNYAERQSVNEDVNDELFPEETLLDAASMFLFLDETTELEPRAMPLEWVFGIEAPFLFDDDAVVTLIDAFTEVIDADKDSLRVEIHEDYEDTEVDDEANDDEDSSQGSEFILIYTGPMQQQQLEDVHSQFRLAAEAMEAVYIGVECGEAGELDGLKVESFIEWTENVMNETAQWTMEDLGEVADPMRKRHIEFFSEKGLVVDDGMSTVLERGRFQLRPQTEIVKRLMAAYATVAWVCAPDDVVPTAEVKRFVQQNQLQSDSFSKREAEWLAMPRDDVREFELHTGSVTENLWGLAWILGNAPTVCPCEQPISKSILAQIHEYLGRFEKGLDQVMDEADLQAVEAIITLEDFLYCAQNGFRNIQDIQCGGLIQERRHALTWSLSPMVAWDDTDVSL